MRFYQTPLKNPTAATLSFLFGFVLIATIMGAIRIIERRQLSQTSNPPNESPENQNKTPEVSSQPLTMDPMIPSVPSTAPLPKKSDRTTRTS